MKRLDTGVVQCGEDWPGVFIRGDDAFAFSLAVRHALVLMPEKKPGDINVTIARSGLSSLLKILERSNVHHHQHTIDGYVTLSESPVAVTQRGK